MRHTVVFIDNLKSEVSFKCSVGSNAGKGRLPCFLVSIQTEDIFARSSSYLLRGSPGPFFSIKTLIEIQLDLKNHLLPQLPLWRVHLGHQWHFSLPCFKVSFRSLLRGALLRLLLIASLAHHLISGLRRFCRRQWPFKAFLSCAICTLCLFWLSCLILFLLLSSLSSWLRILASYQCTPYSSSMISWSILF